MRAKARCLATLPLLALALLRHEGVLAQAQLQDLLVTVWDQQGRLVRGLRREDFILEVGNRSQEIATFSANPNTPVSMGIVIDRDPFMFAELEGPVTGVDAAVGAVRILTRSVVKPGDEIMLTQVKSSVQVVEGLTEDTARIDSALRALYTLDVNAGLRSRSSEGGAFLGIARTLAEMKGARHSNRAVIVATNGLSSYSRFAKEIRASEIPIYVVGIGIPDFHAVGQGNEFQVAQPGDVERNVAADRASLQKYFGEVAEQTGGRAELILPNADADIVERLLAFSEVVNADLRGQYRLQYYAEAANLQAVRLRTNVPQHQVRVRRLLTDVPVQLSQPK